jgi:hypothetical protein
MRTLALSLVSTLGTPMRITKGSTALEVFDIFLSRNSADKPAVENIAHKLKDAGVEPWLDKWYLVPGKTFQSGLADALRNCATCAIFIGPNGFGDWAREEVLVAQDRAAKAGWVIYCWLGMRQS